MTPPAITPDGPFSRAVRIASAAGAFDTRSSSDPSIGPYKVSATHEPETLFVEVPAFADFMLRRVVLRPED